MKSAAAAAAETYRRAGKVAYRKGDARAAIQSFLAAVKEDPRDHESLAHLSDLFFEAKDFVLAIEYVMQAVLAEAEDAEAARKYKERFLQLASAQNFIKHSPPLCRAIEICLASPDVHLLGAGTLWHEQVLLSPTLSRIYRYDAGRVFDAAHFDAAGDYAALLEPFFLLGLKNLLIAHAAFEDFIVHLRGRLLTTDKLAPQDRITLAAALAQYCLFTGYVFGTPPEEEAAAATLRGKKDALSLALLGCYESLHARADAEEIYALRESFPPARALLMRCAGKRSSGSRTFRSITATS